jgi:hypothetical protein
MLEKSASRDDFLAERTRALALVHLTRRDDLIVRGPDVDLGLDYLIHVVGSKKGVPRRFGVVLRGAWPAASSESIGRRLRSTMQALLKRGPFSFPVCLFYFTMADNQGYYAWVAEPLVTGEGRPKLQSHGTATCDTLNRDALDTISDRVNAWYDAFFAELAV